MVLAVVNLFLILASSSIAFPILAAILGSIAAIIAIARLSHAHFKSPK